jgi:hypothetical protein
MCNKLASVISAYDHSLDSGKIFNFKLKTRNQTVLLRRNPLDYCFSRLKDFPAGLKTGSTCMFRPSLDNVTFQK